MSGGLYGPPSAPLAGGVALPPGAVPFANASGALAQDNANLFYDSATHRLSAATYDFGGQVFNVKNANFGAKGDGVTDDSAAFIAAIAAAVAAGGGQVVFPAGTYIVGSMLDLASATGVYLRGAGSGATVIKLKNGANCDIFGQSDFAAKAAANLGNGPHDWGISGITIDGNRANNATGYGIRVYAYRYLLDDVICRNCAQDGYYTAWTTSNDGIISSSTGNSLESLIANCSFHHNGGWGENFNGPHDSRHDNVVWYLNNQSGGQAGGYTLPTAWMGAQFSQCHSWGVSQYYAGYLGGPCIHTNCEWEGASQASLAIAFNSQTISGSQIYAVYRAGLELLNNAALINAQISFGSINSGNHILFTSDGGNNLIIAQMYQTTGTMVGGTRNAATTLLTQTGGGAVAPGSVFAGTLRTMSGSGAAAYSIAGTGTVTASGNEITDATRATGTQGDGRSGDGSYGIWINSTNLVTNGGFETNTTGWTLESSTISRVTSDKKFGTAALQVVTANAQANEGASATFTGAAATQYTVSGWAKLVSGAATVRVALSDSVSGKQGSAGVVLTTTWQRITVTATTGAASSGFATFVETTAQASGTYVIDGIQVETHNYATPYIETNGGTATRALATPTLPAGLLNPVQGWVACCVRPGYATSGVPSDEAGTPRLWGYGADATNRLYMAAVSGAWVMDVGANFSNPPDTWALGDTRILTGRWVSNRVFMSIAGASFGGGAASSPTSTTATYTFGIGHDPTVASRQFDGDILWICGGIGTLTDADSATLNAIGTTDPTVTQLLALNGGAANPTFLWTCATAAFNTLDPVFGQSAHRPSVQLGTATTAVAGANAGTTPPAPVLQNCTDEKGTITFGTGTTPAAGAQVVVTFGSSYGVTPSVVVGANNSATQALGLYVSSVTATGFTLSTANAPSASQANAVYSFNYVARG